LEKGIVEKENENAKVEAIKVSEIQAEVAIKQSDAAKDLALAEPALMRAMSALDSLDRKDLGNCKTMAKPPPGINLLPACCFLSHMSLSHPISFHPIPYHLSRSLLHC
jgi:dynein heavy chain